jgi:Putative Actinobacterial Holin-X, holin superfamily III
MHTPDVETDTGVGEAAKQVAEHASTLARLELELAALELKRKVTALAIGIGLALTAVVLALYMLGFALAGAAAGIASVVPTWAALLIVAGGLLLVIVVLGLLAARSFQQGSPPVPEQAIEEAKITQEALKSDGSHA